ncbi:MAG: hypothetical protein RR550_03685, partial [Rikenellaceae bacterium]
FRTPFSLITNVINAGGQSVIIESVKFVTTNYFTVQSKYVNPNAAGEAIEGFYWIAVGSWK